MTLVSSLAAIAASTIGAAFDHPPALEFEPATPATGADLVLDVRPAGVPTGARATSLVLSAPPGLGFDPRAAARTCGPRRAQAFRCPAASAIGSGQVEGHASGPLVPNARLDFAASVGLFLAPPSAGDLAGVVMEVSEPITGKRGTITGRVVPTATGVALRFDDIAGAQPSVPGVGISIDRVLMRAGSTLAGHSLITTPPGCAQPWAFLLTVTYPGHNAVHEEPVACEPG